MDKFKIIYGIKNINDVLNEYMQIVYLFIRVLIITMIVLFLAENDVKIHWIIQFAFISYTVYPVYTHIFDKIYWSSYIQSHKRE